MTTHSPYRAIADPTRRLILDILREEGPQRAGDLARHFPKISRPAVSKHVKVLKQSLLITLTSQGRERWYHLNPEPLAQVQDWIQEYQLFWENKLHQLKHIVEDD